MASSTTFSPDAVHGGPVVATLSGTFENNNFPTGDRIDRGDIFFAKRVVPSKNYKFYLTGDADKNMVIAAEAVTLNHNQMKHGATIHIPVVVYGRTIVKLKRDDNKTYNGGDFAAIDRDGKVGNPNVASTVSNSTVYHVTFLHPEEKVKAIDTNSLKDHDPYEVFVEPFRKLA